VTFPVERYHSLVIPLVIDTNILVGRSCAQAVLRAACFAAVWRGDTSHSSAPRCSRSTKSWSQLMQTYLA